MELAKALDQIAEIHDQMAKGEVYRGYRPIPIAASGVCGIAAAFLQPWFVATNDPARFLTYWTIAGISCALVAASGIVYSYLRHEDTFSRRCSRRVLAQFVPSLVAGALVTLAFLQLKPVPVALLPGLYAALFSLGIFASRPYLPRAAGWVGLYFLMAATYLLLNANHPDGSRFWGLGIGLTFGIGQIAGALMLHFNVERTHCRAEEY